jgi:hypothetical protein
MGKIKKAVKAQTSRKSKQDVFPSLLGFVFRGMWHDIRFAIMAFIHVFGWPVKAVAHLVNHHARKYPQLRVLHSHTTVSCSLGFVFLTTALTIENCYSHVIWHVTVETLKAAGACPIWDAMSGLFKVRNDIGKNR